MKHTLSFLGLLSATLCAPVFGGEFFDNFDSYPTGSQLGAPWGVSTTGTHLSYTITQDTHDYFNQGTSNKYLSIVNSTGGTPNAQFYYAYPTAADAGKSGQVGFSFYDPNTTDVSGNGSGLTIRLSTSSGAAGSTNTPFGLFLYNGGVYTNIDGSSAIDKTNKLADYSFNQAVSLTVVFNNSDSSMTYGDGLFTLDVGTMDIWINDTLVVSGLEHFNTYSGTGDIRNVTFTSARKFEMYLDDFSMSTTITIPEPAAAGLLMGGLFLGVAAIRRRRS